MRHAMTFAKLCFSRLPFLPRFSARSRRLRRRIPRPPRPPSAPSAFRAPMFIKSGALRCHDQAGSRAPSRDALQKLSAARILRTLDFGLMMAVAYPINRAEREAVANFLGTKTEESPLPASAFCSANISILSGPSKRHVGGVESFGLECSLPDRRARGSRAGTGSAPQVEMGAWFSG